MKSTAVVVIMALALAACSTGPKREDLATKGRALTSEEARTLVTSSKISGRTDGGVAFSMAATPNGKYSGSADGGHPFTGTWEQNDKGEMCFQTDGRPSNDPCGKIYVMDGKHYILSTKGQVRERTFK